MASQSDSAALEVAQTASGRVGSLVRAVRRSAQRNPTMAGGITIVLVMALLAVFAPLLFTTDPTAVAPRERFIPPSADHWFGTDNIGRDLWSRVLFGSRVSMMVGVAVAVVSVLSSIVLGLLAGYYRRLDAVIMRLMDGLMAIPSVLLAMALMALLGGSVQNVIIALCVVETPRAVRVVRSSVLSIREEMFVDAAHALGVPPIRVLRMHILPNTFAPLIVQASFIAASAVLVEAYLSFVGAGPPPEVPSWGNIMAEGRHYISRFVWMIVFPGIFLTLTVLGINLAGDGLRDSLDPKLRSRM